MGIQVFQPGGVRTAGGGQLLARGRPEVLRHGQRFSVAHVIHGGIDAHVGGIALGGRSQVNGGVRQRDARLRHADHFRRARRVQRHAQGVGVCQPHVFRRGDDQPSPDEADVLPGFQHHPQPVQGGVRIRAAHGLDEGGNRVVMGISQAVVLDGLALDGFLRYGEVHMDNAVFPGRGGQNGHFQSRDGLPGVSVRLGGQVVQGFLLHVHAGGSQPALRVRQGTLQQGGQLFLRHGFQRENLGAGQQGGVDRKVGVLRRRADEPDRSLFQMGEQDVLLRLVESVQLIHEEDGFPPVHAHPHLRLGDFLPDVRHVGFHPVEHHEMGVRRPGDDGGQGGLPAAGRTVKNQGGEPVRFNRAPEQLSRRQQVPLSRHFIQSARTHARGQGHGGHIRSRLEAFSRVRFL